MEANSQISTDEKILQVDDLKTSFFTKKGEIKAVDGVSFSVAKGEILGLVGESGSGKSITCLSILGLVPQPAGKVLGISGKGQVKVLMEFPKGAADHAYVPAQNLLILPQMLENKLTAFDLSKLNQ